jgi:hypothetical protein
VTDYTKKSEEVCYPLPPVMNNTHIEYVKKPALEQNGLIPKIRLRYAEIGKIEVLCMTGKLMGIRHDFDCNIKTI